MHRTGQLRATTPRSCRPADHAFGGQAVIEGVMMRGRHSWGVAVRRPRATSPGSAYPLPSRRARATAGQASSGGARRGRSLRIDEPGRQGARASRPTSAWKDPSPGRSPPETAAAPDAEGRSARRRPAGDALGRGATRSAAKGWPRSLRLSVGRSWRSRYWWPVAMAVASLHRGAAGGRQAVRRDLRQPVRLQSGGGAHPHSHLHPLHRRDQPDPRPAPGLRVPRRRAQGDPRLRVLRPAGRRRRAGVLHPSSALRHRVPAAGDGHRGASSSPSSASPACPGWCCRVSSAYPSSSASPTR